jgi:integrase
MTSLKRYPSGSYGARKRISDDVRAEYKRLYNAGHEAKFSAPAGTAAPIAKQLFNEWLAQHEGRVAAIRAARDGTGLSLTPQQARHHAGEWYQWWTERHAGNDQEAYEDLLNEVQDAILAAVSPAEAEQFDPDDLWKWPQVRDAVRPVLADISETSQFLAAKQIVLTNNSRNLFLDFLYEDLAAALRRLIRLSGGDYSPDTYTERFPRATEVPDSGVSPWDLFEQWVNERQPAQSSIESWRYVFQSMNESFEARSTASILPEEATTWIKSLVTPERSAATVRRTWLTASKTVFGWAVESKLVPRNPFADVKLKVPKQRKLRETKAFRKEEWQTILGAALAITVTKGPDSAARRWVPWLCAYSGARPGEMTQLRVGDVLQLDGIPALRITPDAGTVKTREARVVPIHAHLIEQGFLEFVAQHDEGPLFYKPAPKINNVTLTKQKKPRYAQARQRLADWVRGLGVDDPALWPNHAWRHTFKQIAEEHDISDRVSDTITGHKPATVGQTYGTPTLQRLAAALKKFPRYEV